MGQHVAYRLLLGLPVLFGVILFGFILIKSTPGDPAMVIAGPMATSSAGGGPTSRAG